MQNNVSRQSDERHDATRRRRMEIERGGRAQDARRNRFGPCWPSSRQTPHDRFGMANRSRQSSLARSSNKIACTTAARPGIGRCPHCRRQLRVQNCNPVLACTQARASGDRCVALGKHAVCGRHSPSRGRDNADDEPEVIVISRQARHLLRTAHHSASPAVTPINAALFGD